MSWGDEAHWQTLENDHMHVFGLGSPHASLQSVNKHLAVWSEGIYHLYAWKTNDIPNKQTKWMRKASSLVSETFNSSIK